MSVVEKRVKFDPLENKSYPPSDLKSPPRPRIGSLPGPSFDLPDFSLPEINTDLNTPTYSNLKRSLIHRSKSKRDMDTVAPDDIIEEKTYPSSCPAQFFSLLNSKNNNNTTTNTSNRKSDGIEIGSLTILSLLEDPVGLPEEDEEEERKDEKNRNPLVHAGAGGGSSSAIHEDDEDDDDEDEDEDDGVFLVD